jgi:DNA-binding response OmpR family regulator
MELADSMQIRVLIAEPDGPLLETYERFLSRQGFDLVTTSNGPECVNALRQQPADVLLLEPDLPDGWGQRLLRMMHDHELPVIPVIVLSRRDELLDSPSVCVTFHKPTSLSVIAGKIRELVGGNGSADVS